MKVKKTQSLLNLVVLLLLNSQVFTRMVIIKPKTTPIDSLQENQPIAQPEAKPPQMERQLVETPADSDPEPVDRQLRQVKKKNTKHQKRPKRKLKKQKKSLKSKHKKSKKKTLKNPKMTKSNKKSLKKLRKLVGKYSKNKKKPTKKEWGVIIKMAKNKKERKLWWWNWHRRRRQEQERRRREAERRRREAARRRAEAERRRRHQAMLRRHRGNLTRILKKDESKYKVEVQRSRLRQIDRNQFDRLMEVGRKKDAEMWTRTFIYDAILLTEKLIYMEHKKIIDQQRKLSDQNEEKVVKKIRTFYNKNYGKRLGELTEREIEEDIFMEV